MENLKIKSNQELELLIRSFKEELEDVKTEKSLVFRQTGTHVSSSKVTLQMEALTGEIENLENKILLCQQELAMRS